MNMLAKADYLRIKWPITALIASIILGLAIYASLSALDDRATGTLNIARAQLDDAQSRVDLIEEEESTIREYIGRYQEISAAGIVGSEDRLQLLERFANLRETHSLFPIGIEIAEQKRLPLQYGELSGKPVNDPGRPIALMMSSVDFNLPLLHENDLNHLLDGLMGGNEMLLAQSCSISANSPDTGSYLRLGQHFSAACSFSWYTFAIETVATEGAQ